MPPLIWRAGSAHVAGDAGRGQLLAATEALAEAEPFYRKAMVVRRAVLDSDPSNVEKHTQERYELLACIGTLGYVLFMQSISESDSSVSQQARVDEAETLLKEALEGLRETLGPKHLLTVMNGGRLIELYLETDRLDEAARWLRPEAGGETIVEHARSGLGPNHKETINIEMVAARLQYQQAVAQAQGSEEAAESKLMELEERAKQYLGARHERTIHIRRAVRTVTRFREAIRNTPVDDRPAREKDRRGSSLYMREFMQERLSESSVRVAAPPAFSSASEIYFVLGGPGSGKGTQCERVASTFGMTHLSTGDVLREEVRSGSPTGRQIDAAMREGRVVTSETTLQLLISAIDTRPGPFLLEGFPRSLNNLISFERSALHCRSHAAIFLEVRRRERPPNDTSVMSRSTSQCGGPV